MAATSRALVLSRFTELSLNHHIGHNSSSSSSSSSFSTRRLYAVPASATKTVSCLSSGGGVSDDYHVSTRKSSLDRGFSVIANMLKRIEPLDNSVISKAVSDSAKDSMKQTISSMLGLLPSDHFFVTVNFSKQPLDRLLFSSIITGYTLWNADYRISLMRNWDMPSVERTTMFDDSAKQEEEKSEEVVVVVGGSGDGDEDLERIRPQIFGDLSPEALSYIHKLQSELSDVKEELDAQKKKNKRTEYDRGSRNDLLEYLRSLDAEMVTELSQPSSIEVEEIIHQLVQNVLRKLFKEEDISNVMGDSVIGTTESYKNGDEENCGTIGTSRDYLAKLLFWCMLLGHHLRGLENRLHLSCAVGLL
ncbi:DUF760 domain-containing protein [Cephalotus follicularis]|uniref:DUF760 domain-containing protein n=1 Tax=Cephalotus follicularis TaxID=3775 RepID=A0A1Q3CKR8_CEPFO|nr:DUF760 domain-containing protein [Cephalotus follicularis]